ncbi:hypothetical protein SG34_020825 [Thalassomonas viridans]|uniref:Uncharacterized protein n=1 Tax=Thalassomonas viridans TaxID=137584 RepID=A0AAE9YZ25_9GAMM|nr:hypothetical protein [Thalassomonas viridans]WDE03801.1 hypothetical protein SG34_020825 [Thalassomonas viridans]
MLTSRLSTTLNISAGAQERPQAANLAEHAKTASATENKPGRPVSAPVTLKPDTVSLSDEGKAAQASEKTQAQQKETEEANQKAMHKLATSKDDQQKVEEAGHDPSSIDALIEKLEQQIRELEEKIAELAGRTDEASLEQLRLLTGQLMMLNGQLLELQTRKAEMDKGGSK